MRKISVKNALLILLKNLGEASLTAIDEGFLNPAYSFTKPTRMLLGLPANRTLREGGREIQYNRTSLSVSLQRLKKDGLVVKVGSKKYARWLLTSEGKKQTAILEDEISKLQLPPRDGRPRIVCFDIPEKERQKRNQLRSLLVSSGYNMLQKSLWVGDRPISQLIFDDIKNLRIRRFVHIFEISKRGTLRELDFE